MFLRGPMFLRSMCGYRMPSGLDYFRIADKVAILGRTLIYIYLAGKMVIPFSIPLPSISLQ